MSTPNIIILVMLIAGGISLYFGLCAGKTASFEGGGFIGEIGLILIGIGLITIALAWKFIASFF
jgi:hypothetical protein